MISASVLPLAVLVIVRLLGATLLAAQIAALMTCTVLLGLSGWRIGGGRLTVRERLVSATVAGAFGAAMVVLKALLH
jgi:hypothetical protein